MPGPFSLFSLLLASLFVPALSAYAVDCGAARSLAGQGTTIASAELVTSGKLTTPYGDDLAALPAFCRVAGVLRPSPDSRIHFEVWLPVAGWNERYLGVGNGGFAGSIGYEQMASSLRLGFATAGTDTGHEAGAEDAGWAFHHPEKVVDYGYRALHLTTVLAKQMVAAVYGHPAQHSYFDSCSNGGREGLMEAQRFPDDFDGILDGAPANRWTAMLSASISLAQTMYGDPAGYISSMKLPAIHKAVLDACDALDGVKDGIVSDPPRCRFDPAVLLCKDEETLGCLTAPQVKTLARLYAGGTTEDGKSLFPGLMPGSEPSWPYWVVGGAPGAGAGYPANYFRYMVTGDPAWEILKAVPSASFRQAEATTAKDLNATSADLKAFTARGGKLVIYHGWNDAAISPWNTIGYWKSVRETLGAPIADASVRLYMVPGMEHCAGGPGPNSFGQLGLRPAQGPGTGILDLLEGWVERGSAPGPVLAAKFLPGPKGDAVLTRPLCPYPQVGVYDGKGDATLAASFACKAE